MSSKPRPERRRASRTATRKAQTKSRPAAARRPATSQRPASSRRPAATPSKPAARPRGAGFLDYLIIALLVVLAVMLVAGLVLVLRVL